MFKLQVEWASDSERSGERVFADGNARVQNLSERSQNVKASDSAAAGVDCLSTGSFD